MLTPLDETHAQLLSGVELFRGLDRVTLAKLAVHFEPFRVAAGEVIFKQGDPPDGLYLISRGTVCFYAAGEDGAEEITLSTLRRGEAFGEIALLTGAARSASARAGQDGELLRLDRNRFLDLVHRDPAVSLAISAGLIRRLRSADAARLGVEDTIAPDEPVSARSTTRDTPPLGRRWPRRRVIGLVLGGLALGAGWLAAPPPDLPETGWRALVSLVALVPVLALESLPDGATALLLSVVWVLGGVAAPRAALSGFSTTTWILTVTVFCVGAAVAGSGLLYRLALWIVARAGGFRRQVVALGIGGAVLGAALPNATGRMSLVASAVAELGEALRYETGSSPAVGLAMAAYLGFGLMVAPFITSSSTGLLALALLPESSRGQLHFASWALRAAPLHIMLLVGLLGFIIWRYSPKGGHSETGAGVLRVQQMLLGHPSSRERIAGWVTVGMLFGFASQPLHGADPAWVSVIAFVLMAGAGVITLETLRNVNWNAVLLLGVLASMAEVVSSTRLDTWLGSVISKALGGISAAPVLFVAVLAALSIALSLVLRWQAAVPILVLALSPVASSAHIDPWVVAVVALTATNTFFMPYQSTIYLALYTNGGSKMFMHSQARPFAVAYAIVTVVGLLVSVPIWHAMGLV